jgi:hypothetical protein
MEWVGSDVDFLYMVEIAMHAATVQDFLTKIFTTAFDCPRRSSPVADEWFFTSLCR